MAFGKSKIYIEGINFNVIYLQSLQIRCHWSYQYMYIAPSNIYNIAVILN